MRVVGRGGRCCGVQVEQRLVRCTRYNTGWLSTACASQRATCQYTTLDGRRDGRGGQTADTLHASKTRMRMTEAVRHDVLLLLLRCETVDCLLLRCCSRRQLAGGSEYVTDRLLLVVLVVRVVVLLATQFATLLALARTYAE